MDAGPFVPAGSRDSLLGASPKIDTSVPHSARRYDYWLGGKDNFWADRESGDAIEEIVPTIRLAALENRKFMRRVAAYLAERGIRQFLDIGAGIPTSPNLHEIVQGIASDAAVVYVDNDPMVMVHARAWLTSISDGAVAYVEADLRHPKRILADPQLRDTLDFGRPIALLLVAVLHFITDDAEACACVAELVAALPRGSYVVVSHVDDTLAMFNAHSFSDSPHGPFRARSRGEVTRFVQGLELVAPGVVSIVDWCDAGEKESRPVVHTGPAVSAAEAAAYGVVARKP